MLLEYGALMPATARRHCPGRVDGSPGPDALGCGIVGERGEFAGRPRARPFCKPGCQLPEEGTKTSPTPGNQRSTNSRGTERSSRSDIAIHSRYADLAGFDHDRSALLYGTELAVPFPLVQNGFPTSQPSRFYRPPGAVRIAMSLKWAG
ncbi:hypothetical protein [Thermogutta sp.]|uniref:hypothetical protein n=1 Tax=Thermogutta sp. TaxID=1962930 RepID=UPI00321F833B